MAIKFRKKLKIAPGVSLNLTSKGISSTSIGGKGVTVNTGSKRGTALTTSIPGSGLSQTHNLSSAPSANPTPEKGIGIGKALLIGVAVLIVLLVIFG